MVGELAGALPHEGGYYAWVRRAWAISGISGSMAVVSREHFRYGDLPDLVRCLSGATFPAVNLGHRALLIGLAVVAIPR